MTQEEKDLLLKDLCARLPYKVKAYVKHYSKWDSKWYEGIYTIKSAYPGLNEIYVTSETGSVDVLVGYDDYKIKPYLFPMSSMTDEQSKELEEIDPEFYSLIRENGDICVSMDVRGYDWLNKNHIDYRCLIEKGLAIDATGLNIY